MTPFPHTLNRILADLISDLGNATGRNDVKKISIDVAVYGLRRGNVLPHSTICGEIEIRGYYEVTHVIAAAGRRLFRCVALLLGIGLTAPMLSGCGSISLPGFLNTNSTAASNQPAASAVEQKTTSPIAFAPVIGAPPDVAKQLSSSLVSQVEQRNVNVSKDSSAKVDYTVRGYLVASPDKKGTKLSYIWDVTDKSGKRAHRIKGEEVVAGKQGSDPWAMVNKGAVDNIAKKTAVQIAAWLPKHSKSTASSPSSAPKKVAAVKPGASKPSPSTSGSTASAAKSGEVMAIVPTVVGAPGDGKASLTKAIKKQLYSKGIKLTSRATPATYTVKGAVALGKPKSGKQDISIEWRVIDPKGKKLGVVSQKNTIPQGSLDGAWGKTADAAAEAAAQGIVKLLPRPK